MTETQPDQQPTSGGSTPLLTVLEACAYLRISRWTFYRLVQSRELQTITIGRRRLVVQTDLDAYVDAARERRRS